VQITGTEASEGYIDVDVVRFEGSGCGVHLDSLGILVSRGLAKSMIQTSLRSFHFSGDSAPYPGSDVSIKCS